jgi:uncharacterized membrane protein YadS
VSTAEAGPAVPQHAHGHRGARFGGLSVVAASTVFGASATRTAVVVKLARSLAIIPMTIGAALFTERARRRSARSVTPTARARLTHVVPLFMVLFVLAAAVNRAGLISSSAAGGRHLLATWLITAALAGIGLSTSLPGMRAAGLRPLILGASLWFLVASSSLIVQAATGTLN